MSWERSRSGPRSVGLLSFALVFAIIGSVQAGQPLSWDPRGPGGGGALFVPTFSPNSASELYLSTDMGDLYHSTDMGASWTVVNFSQIGGGRSAQVGFTNNASIAYCLDGYTSIPKKTTDGGTTWATITDPSAGAGCYYLFVDPYNTANVIVSDSGHMYYSTNSGTSWTSKYTAANLFLAGAFFDGAGKIYVGSNYGLLVSNNSGTTFALSAATGLSGQMVSLAGAKSGATTRLVCVTVPSGVTPGYATETPFSTTSAVYSLDVGGNWTARTIGVAGDHVNLVGMARADILTVYASGMNDTWGWPIVYKSTNGGANWSNILGTTNNTNVYTGWAGYHGDVDWGWGSGSLGLAVSPIDANRAAWSDYGYIHVTTNGGTMWQQAYTNPADQNAPGVATPKGRTYHSVGLEQTSCWWLCWSDASNVFAGYTDIKGCRSTDGGSGWSFNYTGHTDNTMYCVVKHANGNLYAATSPIHDMYQSTYLDDARIESAITGGKVLCSTDKGATWATIHDFGRPVVWVCLDPGNANRMYVSVVSGLTANGGIWRSDNINLGASATWTKLANPPRTQGHPFNIRILNDSSLVCSYSGRRFGGVFTTSSGVFLSTDGGASWADRTDANMQYWVQDVVIDPNDSNQNTWWAGVFNGWGGTGNNMGGLYKTTNRGTSWTRVQYFQGVKSVTFNPASTKEMYITTESSGLYYCGDATVGAPVLSLVTAYPFLGPTRVFFNPYNSNEIWITSFGNGMRLGNSGPTPVLTTITVSPATANVMAGGTQLFTATAKDQFGGTMSPQPTFAWTVQAGGGAIAASGLLTAATTAGGPFTVTASAGGKSGTASATITPTNTVGSIAVTPTPVTVVCSATRQFTATAKDQYNNTMAPQPSFTWSVPAAAGTVSSSGFFTAAVLPGGPYSLTASAGGKTGTAAVALTNVAQVLTSIAVTPATATISTGGTQQFTASGLDQFGGPMIVQPTITWSASGGGTVSSSGLFIAGTAAGAFTVFAAVGGINGSAAVTVQNQPPAISSQITSNPASAIVGQSVTFTIAASDPQGGTLTFLWDYGDGTSDATGTHIYTLSGTYSVTVTITNGAGLSVTSAPFSLAVAQGSGGQGTGALLPLKLLKANAMLKFTATGADKCSVSGLVLSFPAGFQSAGVAVNVSVGGATAAFMLDSKGAAKSGPNSFKLRLKKGPRAKGTKVAPYLGGDVPFALKLKGALAQAWSALGVDPAATIAKAPVAIEVRIQIGIDVYGATATLSYSAKAAKSGKLILPPVR